LRFSAQSLAHFKAKNCEPYILQFYSEPRAHAFDLMDSSFKKNCDDAYAVFSQNQLRKSEPAGRYLWPFFTDGDGT
jgi:hypothetical protein